MLQLSKVVEDQTTIDINLGVVRGNSENMPYELLDPLLKRENYYFPVIRSAKETIEEIIGSGKSMARFGDDHARDGNTHMFFCFVFFLMRLNFLYK